MARYRFAAIIFFLHLAVPTFAFTQGKPEKERIRISYSSRAIVHTVPYVTTEAGFFREEGIQVEIVQTTGPLAPLALISGDVDFANMSGLLLISASVQYPDLVMLGGFTRYIAQSLISRPEIPTVKELRGKIVGVQRPGDGIERNARFALRHLGLNPDKDVKLVYLGSTEVMWPALESGKVDATMLSPPTSVLARRARMNVLVNLSDLKLEYQGSVVATRRSFIRDHPNLTQRVVRALVRGLHFFKTRREDTLLILSKFFATKDREALEETWKYNSDMPAKPYAVDTAVQAVIDHLAERDPRYAQRKPAEFIESRPLLELDRSGAIDRLYGKN
ncbi:MAG: ABC transporter substrate-binding protein [Candidatus Binatia bacterium]